MGPCRARDRQEQGKDCRRYLNEMANGRVADQPNEEKPGYHADKRKFCGYLIHSWQCRSGLTPALSGLACRLEARRARKIALARSTRQPLTVHGPLERVVRQRYFNSSSVNPHEPDPPPKTAPTAYLAPGFASSCSSSVLYETPYRQVADNVWCPGRTNTLVVLALVF